MKGDASTHSRIGGIALDASRGVCELCAGDIISALAHTAKLALPNGAHFGQH